MSKRASVALALWILGSAACYGQVYTANLTGIVTDPNQAIIPGAVVRLKNVDTDEERQTATGPAGRFTLSQLLPGTYDLTAEMQGFKVFVNRGVRLVAGQNAELNFNMQLGEVTQTVEVQGAPVQIDTQTANKDVSLTQSQVQDLPLNGGNRNPYNLVWAQAGVVGVIAGISAAPGDENQGRFAMNGGRDESVLLMTDGVSSQGGDWSSLFVAPGADAVAEIHIVANSYDAQYGKSGGGVISIVSKGGTSQFHGNFFEFFRNGHLDANSWANNRNGVAKPKYHKNEFGGTIGGPIWASKKLYFFGGYDATRVGNPTSVTWTVPTALQRKGDFSQTFNANGSQAVIFNPFSTRPNPAGAGFVRDAFPNNVVPAEMFDPVALNVMNLYPLANSNGAAITQGNNRFDSGKTSNPADRYDFRVDWVRTEKHTFYIRGTREKNTDFGATYPTNPVASRSFVPNWRYQFIMGNTFIVQPSFVVNVLLGWGRWAKLTVGSGWELWDQYNGATLGLPKNQVSQFQINSLPNFAPSGYNTIGSPSRDWRSAESHSAQMNATKEHEGHSLKFGASAERTPLFVTTQASPTFSFGRGMTSGPVGATDSTTSGNAIASMLLGVGASGTVPINASAAMNATYFGLYVQDTWRITNKLTLNYGLRWESQRPRTDRFNQFSWFNPTVANPLSQQVGLPLTGGLEFATPDKRGLWDADNFDWAPRFGLAYKLPRGIVFRAGYGIYYLLGYAEQQLSGLYGFSSTTTWNTSVGGDLIHPLDLLRNPFPNGLNQPTARSQGLLTGIGQSPNAWSRLHPTGYTQNYSVDVQVPAGRNGMFEVGYSGSLGRKLLYGYAHNANQLPIQDLSLGSALDTQVKNPFFGIIPSGPLSGTTIPMNRLLRPYPQFDSLGLPQSSPGTSSEYNALNIKFQKRWSDSVSVIATYVHSKALDNASENQGWEISDNIRDVNNLAAEWSTSAHDVPNSFVTTLIYEIPVGKGKKFGSHLPSVVDGAIGGWEFSVIGRLIDGLPVQVTAPNTLSQYGIGVTRPNANLSDVSVPNPNPARWFNTQAFTPPANYTNGNIPRFLDQIRQGPYKHADLSIMKNFRFKERFRMQARGEMFNCLNTAQFSAPNTTLGNAAFGTVTGTKPGRIVQFGLKLYY